MVALDQRGTARANWPPRRPTRPRTSSPTWSACSTASGGRRRRWSATRWAATTRWPAPPGIRTASASSSSPTRARRSRPSALPSYRRGPPAAAAPSLDGGRRRRVPPPAPGHAGAWRRPRAPRPRQHDLAGWRGQPALRPGLLRRRKPADAWPLLPRITAPTLVVRGQRSPILPRGVGRATRRRDCHARLAEIPEAYHHLLPTGRRPSPDARGLPRRVPGLRRAAADRAARYAHPEARQVYVVTAPALSADLRDLGRMPRRGLGNRRRPLPGRRRTRGGRGHAPGRRAPAPSREPTRSSTATPWAGSASSSEASRAALGARDRHDGVRRLPEPRGSPASRPPGHHRRHRPPAQRARRAGRPPPGAPRGAPPGRADRGARLRGRRAPGSRGAGRPATPSWRRSSPRAVR